MSDTDTQNENNDAGEGRQSFNGFTQAQVDAFVAAERRKHKDTIDALTKERDTASTLAEQSKQHLEELEAKLNESSLVATRYKVGIEAGLPLAAVERLQGDSEDALKADAETLSELIAKPKGEGKLAGPKQEPDREVSMNDLIRAKAGRGTSE